MKIRYWIWLVLLVGLIWLANMWEWWSITSLVGGLLAFVYRTKRALGLSLLVGGLGWGLPLLVEAQRGVVFQLAHVIGGILGLGAVGTYVALLLPLLVGSLLALSGAWMVSAVKQLIMAQIVPSTGKAVSNHTALESGNLGS